MAEIIYKVGIYLRLSREDEKLGESGSISTQRELLLNYIKDNKLLFVDEYIDDGVSGTTFDREGFNRMIKDCERKRINMIITKDTSRLGRDHIEFGYYVERYFPEHNIRYVALNDGIDTFNNNSANDMLVFKSAFNDMYVKDISNKLRSSLLIKKKKGLFVGCYAPFGYKKSDDDKNKLVIEPEEASVVKIIFDLFIKGNSISKICDLLTNDHIKTPSMFKNMKIGCNNLHYGVWSTRTINNILKNPTYVGNLTQCRQKKVNYKSKKRVYTKEDEWVIAYDSVDPIISIDTFNLVQDMFKSNRHRQICGNEVTSNLLLRGLIYCKECHHTIGWRDHLQKTKKNGIVHRIYGNCNYWVKRKKQNVCTPHSLKYQVVEDIVLKCLRDIIKNNMNVNNINEVLNYSDKINVKKDNLKKEILMLDNNIVNDNKKIDACYYDKLEGKITFDMYKRFFDNITREINEYKNKKMECENKLLELENNNFSNNCLKIKELLDINNISRTFVSSLIDRVEIDEFKNIDIYFKFKIS